MNPEYTYPETFAWVSAISWIVLIPVAVIFFVPVVREAIRGGPMNRTDLGIGATSLAVCLIAPFLSSLILSVILQSELNSDAAATRRVLRSHGWEMVQGIAVFSGSVHFAWLLSYGIQRYQGLRTFLVYFIPIVWLSMPALGHPDYVFDRTRCRNNLKHIALALHNYHDQYAVFPSSVVRTDDIARSWRVEVLPYLDQAPLRNTYDVTMAWDAAPNAAFAEMKIDQLFCPANYRSRDSQGRYYTTYAGVVGSHTFFGANGSPRTIKDVTDGMSNTIAIVEACGAQIIWSEPRDLPQDEITIGVNQPGPKLGTSRGLISSCHSGGGHVLMTDGAVRFFNTKIDSAVLSGLLTVDGGEQLPGDAW